MTEACCINAYDYGGNFLSTLQTLQKENIGVDVCYDIPENYGTRAFDYITYIDECGCSCCLSGENKIIVHSTQGTIKEATIKALGTTNISVKWSEIFGGNWCKTMVRYKTGGYPVSIEDGTLAVEEIEQNTYSVNGYCIPFGTLDRHYIKIYALDTDSNILSECCGTADPREDKVYGYSGAIQSFTMPAGTYKLQVWGASGFCNASYVSGRGGGYSEGCITLTSAKTVYVAVGQHPSGKTGGWNGGGNGYSSYGMGGGGATDIRIGGNTLYHRVIVAGGSGGNNCSLYCAQGQGGAGGGACGMEAYNNTYNSIGQARSGGGASQNSPGCAWCTNGSQGAFGQGGTSCSGYNAGGGGGGWYGGGGAFDNDSDNDGRGGGGGSGYTWTAATCQYHPAPACLSGIPYLTNAKCCPGCVSFVAPGGGNETGHLGHGCAKITKIS